MSDSVLVIGGGIAGIQAALDLAEAGARVVMVEREATIGGVMAVLDKNFPTLDCSICIEAPKMSEVGLHPNIEIFSLAEVDRVGRHTSYAGRRGIPGDTSASRHDMLPTPARAVVIAPPFARWCCLTNTILAWPPARRSITPIPQSVPGAYRDRYRALPERSAELPALQPLLPGLPAQGDRFHACPQQGN